MPLRKKRMRVIQESTDTKTYSGSKLSRIVLFFGPESPLGQVDGTEPIRRLLPLRDYNTWSAPGRKGLGREHS